MGRVRVQEAASHRLDEIYRYTRERWGEAQAQSYITGLFAAFEKIETGQVSSRLIPAEFGVEGYVFKHERHFIYWRRLGDGAIGIVTSSMSACTRSTGSGRISASRALSPGSDSAGDSV